MKVLVSGGAGYIGSTVARALLEHGHDVIVFDNLSRGHKEAVPEGARLVAGDLSDLAALAQVFETNSVEAVLHFAALIEVGESMKVPSRYFLNNTANTCQLLDVMHIHGVAKFVFSSTAAVYGNPERTPIQESDALAPTSAYGDSKLMVERVLQWMNTQTGFRYASLRYFNAAGAVSQHQGEDHQPESHLIPLTLRVALGQRENIKIFGTDFPTPDGTCVRDYIHVADLASAHVLALEALKDRDRMIYNLGSGSGFSVREVIETARGVTGHPIPAEETGRRPGDPAVLVAGSEKIQTELGWAPQHPELETIISSAWEWHRRHPNGYGT